MAEMTLELFLRRIADTGYLPDWANDGATELLAGGVDASSLDIEPNKWCPFTRNLINDNRSLVPATEAGFNRVVIQTSEGGGKHNIKIAPCIKDACAVWNGQACGLMAPIGTTAMVQAALDEFQRIAALRAAEAAEAEADAATEADTEADTGATTP